MIEHLPMITTDAMLRLILNSRVYDVAHETPLDRAHRLSRRLGNEVLLKREDLQPVFSYKLRGAYNRVAHMTESERARGVIAASAGNHAQGVAFAARHLGLDALIVMPKTTPAIKVEAVSELGAEVVLSGDNYTEAKRHCDELVVSPAAPSCIRSTTSWSLRDRERSATRSCATSWVASMRSSSRSAAAG